MNCSRSVTKNFAAPAASPSTNWPLPRGHLDLMHGNLCSSPSFWWRSVLVTVALVRTNATASEFRFDHDTFMFANQTVFEYHEGHPSLRKPSAVKRDAYKRHCFVLCRTV